MSKETAFRKTSHKLLDAFSDSFLSALASSSSSFFASKKLQIPYEIITNPPTRLIRETGRKLTRKYPTVTMMALVIVNATEPAANTTHGFTFVASERSRRASLSVNSATKIAAIIVRNAFSSTKLSDIGNLHHLVLTGFRIVKLTPNDLIRISEQVYAREMDCGQSRDQSTCDVLNFKFNNPTSLKRRGTSRGTSDFSDRPNAT